MFLPFNLPSIKINHNKNTSLYETITMPAPKKVVIPLLQHIGEPCEPVVRINDAVKIGQKIGDSEKFPSVPIHASISGRVVSIQDFTTSTGIKTKAITIESDSNNEYYDGINSPSIESHADFVKFIRDSGLVGLGGAGFPTFVKLDPDRPIKKLIINAAECEAYVTSDNREMLENFDSILLGMKAVKTYLNIPHVTVAIENNKPRAILSFLQKLKDCHDGIYVKILKSRYPQGAEKVLIYNITHKFDILRIYNVSATVMQNKKYST